MCIRDRDSKGRDKPYSKPESTQQPPKSARADGSAAPGSRPLQSARTDGEAVSGFAWPGT
eukprot:13562908-Alexandrium_andersonii.AAC.1